MSDNPRPWQLATFVAVLTISTYLLVEALFSAAYIYGYIYPPTSGWFFENSGKTVHFDPVRGIKLTTIRSRVARVTNGQVEYIGTLRGNSQGFPDADDFSPSRSDPTVKRIAIFGDSFSAAQYLQQNWPDTVERLADQSGTPIELLNFSVDGGGLANWWGIITTCFHNRHYCSSRAAMMKHGRRSRLYLGLALQLRHSCED